MERQRQREKQTRRDRGREAEGDLETEAKRERQRETVPGQPHPAEVPNWHRARRQLLLPSPTSHSHSEWGLGPWSPSCRCHTHRPQDPLGAPPAALGPHSPLSRRKCLCPGGEGLGGGASKCLSRSDLRPLPLSLNFLTCEMGTTVFPRLSTVWAGLWGQPGGWGGLRCRNWERDIEQAKLTVVGMDGLRRE